MELQAIIDKIGADYSLEPDVEIEAETELLMSGILDSFGVVGLVAWLEDETGTVIQPGSITFENFERPEAIHALCTGAAATSET